MEARFLIYVAVVAVAALLAAIAIWTPRSTLVRSGAVLVAALFFPASYVALTEILSQPKPMEHEWFKRHVDEATVLGASFDEGRAIYLWLRLDDSFEPRFYVLPWRHALAEKLENLIDEAMNDGASVKITEPFSKKGWDDIGDMNVEIERPPLPPMKLPPPPAQAFNPREREI